MARKKAKGRPMRPALPTEPKDIVCKWLERCRCAAQAVRSIVDLGAVLYAKWLEWIGGSGHS